MQGQLAYFAIACKKQVFDNNHTMPRPNVGVFITKQREKKNFTIRRLAIYADISDSYLGQIERGERFPSADMIKKLAGPLVIPKETLMREAGYPDKPPKPKVIKPGIREEIRLLVKESFGRYPLSEEAFEEVAEYIGFKLEEHKIQEAKKADK